MGRPKVKIIDDSKPAEEPKKKVLKKQSKDDLVAKINAKLGVKEEPSSRGSTPENATETPGVEPPKLKSKPLRGSTSKKVKPRSKKYQEIAKDLDKSKSYPLDEAVDLVKKISYSKFNGTLEAHINTAALGIRGLVSLPYASGKKLRILAFGKGADTSGADIFGIDETIEQINKGKIDFDLLLTTPDWMPKLAKVAKNLGPRGLMPNPKSGTITTDLKKSVESFQSGKTEYKTEAKSPVIHLALGKLDQPTEQLAANIKMLIQTIGKTRVKKVALSPTMGPSVKVDLASI